MTSTLTTDVIIEIGGTVLAFLAMYPLWFLVERAFKRLGKSDE